MWTQVGAVGYVLARDGVDRGPAGSLVQARDRERVRRRATRQSPLADWRLWLGGILTVYAVALVAAGGEAALLGALAGAGALALAHSRYRPRTPDMVG